MPALLVQSIICLRLITGAGEVRRSVCRKDVAQASRLRAIQVRARHPSSQIAAPLVFLAKRPVAMISETLKDPRRQGLATIEFPHPSEGSRGQCHLVAARKSRPFDRLAQGSINLATEGTSVQ